jgi:hypothetical protein
MVDALKWLASISGMIAAFMISLDHGRRMTGWGFALFVLCSVAWIISGLIDAEGALAAQNVVLLCINIFGVYRYLIRKKPA